MPDVSSRESHVLAGSAAWQAAVRTGLDRLAAACPPGGPGWCAAAACILEAAAPKPGNVHPGAAFPDLSHDDLVAAALAIAPAMDRARHAPLGRTILDAVTAAVAVTRSNANLGIVLTLAPLVAAPSPERVAEPLARLGPDDAADTWRAIALARPGGLGTSDRHDLAAAPPADLLDAMRAAADRDQIARLWVTDYAGLFAGPVADLAADLATGRPLEEAIVLAQLRQLAREPDSLVARRHGHAVAADVSRRAAAVLAAGPGWRLAADAFDRSLRMPHRVNPGTTADLLAAALYILLADGRVRLA